MKQKIIFLAALLLSFGVLKAQTTVNNVTTFYTSKTINKYIIKSNITKVTIKGNVTLTGSFYVDTRTTDLTIEGLDSATSIIKGTGNLNQDVPGIECNSKITLTLKNFKSYNPDWYHTRATSAKIVATKVQLVDDRNGTGNNSDGFSGGNGSSYDQCYVNTWDDSFKIYYGSYTISNTKIVHNKNGAPFQMGWGDAITDTCYLTLTNVTVQGNSTATIGYNQGIFSWAGGTATELRNITGKITRTGNLSAKLYRFKPGTNNKKMNFKTAGMPCTSSTNYLNEGGTGNKIVLNACVKSEEIEAEASINNSISNLVVLPNPAKNMISVSMNSERANLQLFNSAGRVVKSAILLNGKSSIDVSNLERGMYLLRAQTQGNCVTTKFIKE